MTGFAPNLGAAHIELGDYAADSPWKVICYLAVRDIVRSLSFYPVTGSDGLVNNPIGRAVQC